MADEEILTSVKPSPSQSPFNPPSRIICNVCQKQFSQYTCPRCNSRYCSLHCYKSHSVRCTEAFMRENVVEELRQIQPDDDSKRKMLDILKRVYAEEEEEDSADTMDVDDSVLSEETVRKILSGGSVSFDDLSPEEKKRFQRAVASGELSKLIEPWEPWWLKPSARTISLSKEGTQLVQPVVSPQDDGSDQSSEIPPGPETPLSPVKKLISVEPSPLLAIHLIDIIYSYCFTLRLYNGDWQSDSIGSSIVVLSISSVLNQVVLPESVLEALSYCLERTCSPDFRHMGGLQFGLALIDDVINVLSLGGPALICLLCDLWRLIQSGEKELKAEKQKKSEIRSKLKHAERKVYFIMCWAHEQPEDAWSSLAAIVAAEKSAMDGRVGKISNEPRNKSRNKGKVVIQEMK